MSLDLTNPAAMKVLQELPDWSILKGKLHREFVFESFAQAMGFMTQVAIVAERINHHPEWFNIHRRVVVFLTTQEKGCVTKKDFELAHHMERIAGRTRG